MMSRPPPGRAIAHPRREMIGAELPDCACGRRTRPPPNAHRPSGRLRAHPSRIERRVTKPCGEIVAVARMEGRRAHVARKKLCCAQIADAGGAVLVGPEAEARCGPRRDTPVLRCTSKEIRSSVQRSGRRSWNDAVAPPMTRRQHAMKTQKRIPRRGHDGGRGKELHAAAAERRAPHRLVGIMATGSRPIDHAPVPLRKRALESKHTS